ncbi:MAG: hypothetical protein WDO18_11360 [Acidobacteriota bacterium]
MLAARIALACIAVGSIASGQTGRNARVGVGQIPGPIPTFGLGTNAGVNGVGVGPYRVGAGAQPGYGYGYGTNGYGANGYAYPGAYGYPGNGYAFGANVGGWYGYYYWNQYMNRQTAPEGTYENPSAVKPVGELAPALVAPTTPSTEDWDDVRSSFTSASARVASARQAVEELRARLAAMGQSPRANLVSNTANAEATLKSAQELMTAGNLERSRTEIRRASDLAGVVLKEFGR